MKETDIQFNPAGPMASEDVLKMQDEINRLRAESKSMKSRFKCETDSRKNWQEISKKKEQDLDLFKQQLIQVTREYEQEKQAHQKTT